VRQAKLRLTTICIISEPPKIDFPSSGNGPRQSIVLVNPCNKFKGTRGQIALVVEIQCPVKKCSFPACAAWSDDTGTAFYASVEVHKVHNTMPLGGPRLISSVHQLRKTSCGGWDTSPFSTHRRVGYEWRFHSFSINSPYSGEHSQKIWWTTFDYF
jgi:hypothetical protein